MLGFSINAEFPKLLVKLFHKCRDSRLDYTEIMILKLLAFRPLGAEQRTACEHEVFSCLIIFLIYKEVFLLRADGSYDTSCGGVSEKTQHAERLFADTSIERRSGVFLSSTSPPYEQKAVGIYSEPSFIKA